MLTGNQPCARGRGGRWSSAHLDDMDLERGMLQVRQSAWRGKLGDPKTDESIRVVTRLYIKRGLLSIL